MSDPRPITGPSAPSPQVHGAIQRASQATGVDFAYLLGEARLESSFNPAAKAATSSAAGLYQFTGSTWLQTLGRHGAEHGMDWASGAISGGRVGDPALRGAILDMRFDPDAAALMAGELANDNRMALTGVLGREPDAGELYLAHFLGIGGATKFVSALAADPDQSAAALFPAAAGANRAIFYDGAGARRSLGGVKELLRGKMADAMGDNDSPYPSGEGVGGWGPTSFATPDYPDSPHPPAPSPEGEWGNARPSMAETLAATFGTGGDSPIPPHVRAAYGKLQAFGL
ncbi:MAG: transglycosylase SLT domain-containing protein [Novosphingobium sp.]